MSEIIEPGNEALHAYIPFLPAVKTGHPHGEMCEVCLLPPNSTGTATGRAPFVEAG